MIDLTPSHGVEVKWSRDYKEFLRNGLSEDLQREFRNRVEKELGIQT
jgi:hypothetical protein